MKLLILFFMFVFAITPVSTAQTVELAPITIVGSGSLVEKNEYSQYAVSEYLAKTHSAVDIQARTGFGYLQDVSIRGGVFEDARVVLEGVPMNNPQTGHFNLSLPVVSCDIEAVDVDANGQALRYRLKEPYRQGGVWRVSGGNRGYADTMVCGSYALAGGYHRISFEGTRTDGLRDETDGYRRAGSYSYAQEFEDQDVMIYVSLSDKKFGAQGAYAAPWYMKEEERIRQELITGRWRHHGDFEMTIQPYIHRTQDIFWLDRDQPDFYRNDHVSYVAGNRFEIADEQGRYAAVSFQRDELRSTNLGERDRFFYSGEAGVKIQDEGRWRYDGKIGLNYYDDFPFEISPEAFVEYALTSFWRTHAKAARMFRQPSFTELYYDSPSDAGNPDLLLQRSDNVEWGLSYEAGEFMLAGDLFYRRQKNTIDWARNTSDTRFQAVNAGTVNVRGFDMAVTMPCRLGMFDTLSAEYTRLDVNKARSYDISKYVFDYLRDRFVATLSADKGRWHYGMDVTYEYHLTLKERWLFGAHIRYDINSQAQIFVIGENIFDEDYEEYPYIQGDPLFVKAGLELRF